MGNSSIVSQIRERIAALKQELVLLERALMALGSAGSKASAGRTGAGSGKARSGLPPPAGTFNLLRPQVLACLSGKPATARALVTRLANRRKVELDGQGQRVMWARVHQHLLQLESAGSAKRTPEGWVRQGD